MGVSASIFVLSLTLLAQQPSTIRVNVKPVPGEKKLDNNRASYPAIFTR